MEIDRELGNIVERLRKEFNVKAVILFGSRARGDWKPWSDFDILVIADFGEGYLDRIKRLLEVIGDIPLDIEFHPYTVEEALEMLRRCNPIIIDALEEGIILYKTNEIDKLFDVYRELKRRGLRRTETSMIIPSDIEDP